MSALDAPGTSQQTKSAQDLVLDNLDLARKLARRYLGKGQPLDDLTQVAMIGLIAAANRFDPERGTNFSSFAIPTILGEIRRYFRDGCWTLRIPRRLHDLHYAALAAQTRLTGRLGRSPTVGEIAADLQVEPEEIVRALDVGSAYTALSLDAPASNRLTGKPDSLADTLGELDGSLELVEMRETVRRLLPSIPQRESRILVWVFYESRSQAEIARELGISQMHVSRLLAMTLGLLRAAVLEDRTEIRWPKSRQRRHRELIHPL